MFSASDLRKGLKVEVDNQPWVITEFEFCKPGKGTALYRCKLKNIITGFRFSIRAIFLASIVWSGIANLLFALYAHDYPSGLLLRARPRRWTDSVLCCDRCVAGGATPA